MTSARLTLLICTILYASWIYAPAAELPSAKPVPMKLVGKLNFKPITESSGIVRSKLWPDWIWTHNDSGDSARIFAVLKSGNIVKPSQLGNNYKGIEIKDAVNIDWEDITTDESGNIIGPQ